MNNPSCFVKATVVTVLLVILFTGCVSLGEKAPSSTVPAEWVKAGEISLERRFWNFFFQPPGKMRRELLTAAAREEARRRYGSDARIEITGLTGRWHPLSLLLGGDILGFVEDARLTASVFLPGPAESEPLPEVTPVRYRYEVIPEAEYHSPREYTEVVFRTREMLEAEIDAALAEGIISPEDAREQRDDLPPGGALRVSLGRSEINNAISKWFTFILRVDQRQIFSRRGREDIPYVPGGDKLWWNEIYLPLEEELTPPYELEVRDRFQNTVYRFTVVRQALP